MVRLLSKQGGQIKVAKLVGYFNYNGERQLRKF
jgi:hypothetical protein